MRIRFRTRVLLLLLAFSVLLVGAVLSYLVIGLRKAPPEVTRRIILGACANAALAVDSDQVTAARGDGPEAVAAREALREHLLTINALPPHFTRSQVRLPQEALDQLPKVPDPFKNLLLLVKDEAGQTIVLTAVYPRMEGSVFPEVPDPMLERGWREPAGSDEVLPFGLGGHSMIAYAPVRDESGRAVALLAVQACGIHLDIAQHELLIVSLMVFIGAILFAVVPAAIISRMLDKPIQRLYRGMHEVGEGRLDTRVAPVETGDEFERLTSGFNDMVRGLQDRDRLKRALGLAQEIQQRLLPHGAPDVQGFDLAGRSVFCYETGGDYHDFVTMKDGRVAVMVGDVSGHGIGAALLMASMRVALHAALRRPGIGPAGLVRAANIHLAHSTGDSHYATLFCVILDPADGSIRWAAGGHDSALLCRKSGEVEMLGNTGLPAGMMPDAEFEEVGPLRMEAGDALLIGTDGIWEQRNEADEMFGRDRLKGVFTASCSEPAARTVQAVLDAVEEFRGDVRQGDDVTVVVMRAQ